MVFESGSSFISYIDGEKVGEDGTKCKMEQKA